MRFTAATDQFVREMFAEGRFNSPKTEESYRATLSLHAEDVRNRDPRTTNRDDVMRTLGRWANANSRALHRSHLVSFYDWAMETGVRRDNPARQTRRPKTRRPVVYRLTRDEVRAFRAAARGPRERAMADFGLLAGLRAKELQGLQGRHLRRPGWVWVSADIAKGGRERWVPVLPELEPTFQRAAEQTADSEFVLPAHRSGVHGPHRLDVYDPASPMSYPALYQAVGRVGRRAGIAARVTPHMLRHAFGDHVARFAGIKVAQFVLGHATVATTEGYTGAPTLDEIRARMEGFGFGTDQLPADDRPVVRLVEPAGSVRRKSLLWSAEPDPRLVAAVDRAVFAHFMSPRLRAAAREMAAHA